MNEAETGSVDLKAAQAAMKSALSSGYDEKSELDPENLEESLLDRMPDPTGWRILILPYRAKSRTDKGLYLPQDVQERNSISTQVGYVLKVGPLAYKDSEKFPNGPWCKQSDWVMFARYAGSRFQIDGGEVRILNDDEILATILRPEDIHHM